MRVQTMDGSLRGGSLTREKSGSRGALGHYARFGAMLATSGVIMYLLTYVNTYAFAHAHWSTTRFYMTLIMVSAMAVVMLSFMLSMYKSRRINLAIYAASAAVFVVALVFLRNQSFIQDSAWMNAMIPHHSIAVLTSNRAAIEDVRVKALSDRIIQAQMREIGEMEWLLEDISKNGTAKTEAAAAARPVPSY